MMSLPGQHLELHPPLGDTAPHARYVAAVGCVLAFQVEAQQDHELRLQPAAGLTPRPRLRTPRLRTSTTDTVGAHRS